MSDNIGIVNVYECQDENKWSNFTASGASEKPAHIYSVPCLCCEIERLKEENKRLEELCQNIDRGGFYDSNKTNKTT